MDVTIDKDALTTIIDGAEQWLLCVQDDKDLTRRERRGISRVRDSIDEYHRSQMTRPARLASAFSMLSREERRVYLDLVILRQADWTANQPTNRDEQNDQ